jgi:hypothetical protein
MVVSSLILNNELQIHVIHHNPFDEQIIAGFSVPHEGHGRQPI